MLFPEFATDPNFVERFRREAQAAANLNHPNIVGVYDWGRQGGTYFIVMEYVNGRTLADILRADGTPAARRRPPTIAREVAAALGFAHRNGVVHRDVKPANILVATTGEVKVADFGIARAINAATEQDLTQAGAVMGTATYFSPEQAQGASPDPRSDLYSLGIVMYEMVAGRPPFTRRQPGRHRLQAGARGAAAAARPSRRTCPAAYEAIVAKLLAKNPAAPLPVGRRPARRPAPLPRRPAPVGRPRRPPARRPPLAAAAPPPPPPAPAVPTAVVARPADAPSPPARRCVPRTSAAARRPPRYAYDEPPRRTGWLRARHRPRRRCSSASAAVLLYHALKDDGTIAPTR